MTEGPAATPTADAFNPQSGRLGVYRSPSRKDSDLLGDRASSRYASQRSEMTSQRETSVGLNNLLDMSNAKVEANLTAEDSELQTEILEVCVVLREEIIERCNTKSIIKT